MQPDMMQYINKNNIIIYSKKQFKTKKKDDIEEQTIAKRLQCEVN